MEGFCADEYFYYHFADKSEQERASFISDQNRVIFCDTVNKFKNLALFDDKIKQPKSSVSITEENSVA